MTSAVNGDGAMVPYTPEPETTTTDTKSTDLSEQHTTGSLETAFRNLATVLAGAGGVAAGAATTTATGNPPIGLAVGVATAACAQTGGDLCITHVGVPLGHRVERGCDSLGKKIETSDSSSCGFGKKSNTSDSSSSGCC